MTTGEPGQIDPTDAYESATMSVVAHGLLNSAAAVANAATVLAHHWDGLDDATRAEMLEIMLAQSAALRDSLFRVIHGNLEPV